VCTGGNCLIPEHGLTHGSFNPIPAESRDQFHTFVVFMNLPVKFVRLTEFLVDVALRRWRQRWILRMREAFNSPWCETERPFLCSSVLPIYQDGEKNYFTGRPYSDRFKDILRKRKELAVYDKMAAFFEIVGDLTGGPCSGSRGTAVCLTSTQVR
jgi:hypothetical protein